MSAIDDTVKVTAGSLNVASPDHSIQLALLAAIVASSDDAIVSKTLEGRIQSWNRGAARIFGYEAEEVIGKSITLIIPPELQQEEQRILEQVKGGERVDHYDTIRLTKDGRRIPISLTVSPIRDARGVIVGASKVARDISERKAAERALLESERLLAAQTRSLAELNEWSTRLWRSSTLCQGLEEILAAVIELLGAQKGNIQLLDRTRGVLSIVAQRGFRQEFLDFFREVSAADDSACGKALRSGERIIVEDIETDTSFAPFRHIVRTAGVRAVMSTPLLTPDGEALAVVSTHFQRVHRSTAQELHRLDLYLRQSSDFIQRCQMEQTLRQSEEALRNADRRKNEFLALLAHELRNPLAPIRYALATNRNRDRTPEQRKRAEEIIDRQVTHMSRLLDDLLDVSRITRDTLELKKCTTELTSIIGAAIETARPLLDEKHHTLSLDLPQAVVRLEADPVRLAQVFSNLLINAAKYTDAGGHIQLRAAPEGNEILISIRDDGIGIARDMMPRLFTIFSQAPTALERAEGGLGIGLSLVRGLVTLHGGSVDARSDGPGRGSEFVVRLPLGPNRDCHHESEPGVAPLVTSAALKILVVDDNRDAADACAMLLEASGHHAQVAYCGGDALELGERFRPDVALLDISLPDFNGYELARRLRASTWARNITLIAVTGWGHGEDRQRAFEAGFDHHLTKPIAPQDFESLLQSLGEAREHTA